MAMHRESLGIVTPAVTHIFLVYSTQSLIAYVDNLTKFLSNRKKLLIIYRYLGFCRQERKPIQ